MKRAWAFLKKAYPLLAVVIAFAWSASAIVFYRRQQTPPETKIELRIGHWQLETGVREAFDQMAAEYAVLNPGVRIVQDAIPESTYGQWMTTQLMGGTAPDMIEVGLGVPYNVLIGFHSRYFMPLTATVNQPNPYNQGTAFETVPWRNTFKDGMRSGYVEELQEYMTVPLAQFGVRVFYNKDLLRRLTGLEEAPRDFQSFIAACERIKQSTDEKGRPYTPVAGSSYHMNMWTSFICDPLTYGAVRRVDFNRDGAVGNDELFVGFKTGRIGFDFPPFVKRFDMLDQLTRQCQTGYTGLGRDEAVFMFVQQRAVFISTGTWDAGSLRVEAGDNFEVGIMDFPIPGPDDPDFGTILDGPVYERPSTGFPFAVTRTSKHPEVALDFLMFLSSKRGNEELNKIIGWIPAISDTRLPPFLEAFEPCLEGVYGAMPVTLGGETIIRWQQLTALFQVNQIGYEAMVADFLPFYLERGVEEYRELRRNRRRGLVRDEQFIASMRYRALAAPADAAEDAWLRYRQLSAGRLIGRDLYASLLDRRLHQSAAPEARDPYEMAPEALARVRERLRREREAR